MSRTFHLTIAYDGTDYSGWQVQPGQRTIQGELEQAAATLVGDNAALETASDARSPLRILGSGRTDAGVHAWGQVARCVLPGWRADCTAVLRGLNSRLPADIAVLDVRETASSFHPIADAIGKRYRYQVQLGGQRDPFSLRTCHRIHAAIDPERLQAAASRFIGERDFAAFQASGAPRNSTVRIISHSAWSRDTAAAESGQTDRGGEFGSRWYYEVEGNGFLYNMVRNLVGTMLEVARGRRPLDWIDEVLQSGDRTLAGATAPANGLILVRVNYPDRVFKSRPTQACAEDREKFF
ncbi:tRNA pseudouridine(38-40) synthase TruA [Allorhodopirellula solitaria]|nr:tRNA pseudouridine(38-40) synthase TruA [Allorhodopirellula solitaria]